MTAPTPKERETARHIAEEHVRLDEHPRLAPEIADALARRAEEQREACAMAYLVHTIGMPKRLARASVEALRGEQPPCNEAERGAAAILTANHNL